MRSQDSYDAHLREFHRWRGDRPLSESLLLEWIVHLRASYRGSTAAVKWAATKWWILDSGEESGWSREQSIKGCAWVEDLSGPFNRDVRETQRMSDADCRRVFDAATMRQKGFILAIRASDARLSDVLNLRPHDQSLPRRVWRLLRAIYNGDEWLIETSTGKRYHRSYVSNQLAALSERVLGKPFRAEAFRAPYNSQRDRALLDGGDL